MTDRLLCERDVRALLHRLRDQADDSRAAGWFNAAALGLAGLRTRGQLAVDEQLDSPPPSVRRLTRIVPWDEKG